MGVSFVIDYGYGLYLTVPLYMYVCMWEKTDPPPVKVAEHSFQVPMPYSPLLLNHLCFGAHFFARVKVNYRSIYSRILTKVCVVAMAIGLVKNKA